MNKFNVNIISKDNGTINEEYKVEILDEYKEKFSDNIWFTRKARIQSAERLKNSHKHTQLLLIEYTLIVAILSVIVLRYNNLLGSDTDMILAIMSIVILVLSLVITNFDMKERSNKFFNNYVNLQTLYLEARDVEKIKDLEDAKTEMMSIKEKYKKVLLAVENHLPIDDICVRVENASTLDSRHPSRMEHFKCCWYKAKKFCLYFSLYTAPILTLVYFL